MKNISRGLSFAFLGLGMLLGIGSFSPALAQYGVAGAPYTQTASVDSCNSSSVSLNSFAINQFYLYSDSGVSVLYSGGINGPGTGNITLQNSPGAAASIVKAYLEVIQENSSCSTAGVSFGSGLSSAGVEVGRGNFENKWTDPRYGTDITGGGENLFFCDVRYDVTSLVTAGVSSYSTNASGVLKGLVVVYTVPATGVTGAVAIGDGLFAWDGGSLGLDYGVTPFAATLDWSCQDSNACGKNQFSRWGGVSTPDQPVSVTDDFYSTTSPGPAQPAAMSYGAGSIFQDSSTVNDTFLDTYQNVPLANASGKITWALGNAMSGEKQFYWVNLLAASCNTQSGPTATPTLSPTPTNSFTPTNSSTPVNTGTFTDTATSTNSFTPSFTPTNSFTSTNSFTPTDTATNSPTPTPSNSPTDSPTTTPTLTPTDSPTITPTNSSTNTPTNTLTVTPSSTATRSPTPTPSNSPSDSPTLTPTSTPTNSPTLTPTNSPTNTATNSPTPTFSDTSTHSFTPTNSFTLTNTPTITFTFTPSFTPTNSLTPTWTFTFTYTGTPTDTRTVTPTNTPTATGTFTFTPTVTFTPTATSTPTATGTSTNTPVPEPYTVKVGVYNAAGELVEQILVEKYPQAVGNPSLQPSGNITSLTGSGSSVTVFDNGVLLATWDGTGSSGLPVSNGNYFIHVDSIDSNGQDQARSIGVLVSRPVGEIRAEICNSAGEVVKLLYNSVNGTTDGPVTSIQLSSSVLSISPGSQAQVLLQMSDGISVPWDGRSADGQYVSNGVYFAQVYSTDGSGGEEVLTRQLAVINEGTRGVTVAACPNIWIPGGPSVILKASAPALTLRGRLYDMDGERVGGFQGPSGTSQADLELDRLASGLYIVLVEIWDESGERVSRQTLKISVRP